MPNRLANETSPYLLQHADNPVDWFPWGKEALQKAQAEDKPIFLSIGLHAGGDARQNPALSGLVFQLLAYRPGDSRPSLLSWPRR